MSDTKKTKQQLIDELQTLRKKIEPNASAQPDPGEHTLLGTVANISSIILSHTNLNDILDALTNEIIATNLFRSLTIMLVDNSAQNIQVVRSIHRDGQLNKDISILPLNTENIVGVVARTNQMTVIEGWDDRFAIDKSISQEQHIKGHENKVSYFIPISQNKNVIAILATGSQKQEKQETLNRIEMFRPIMGQLAVAIRYNQNDEQLQQQTRQLEAQIKTQQQDIEEKDQSLDAFQKIDQALLNTLDIDQLLDALIEHIVIQKYFRSLVISLVNYHKQTMQGVRNAFPSNEGIQHQSGELATYNLSDTQKILPLVVKTGQLQIIDSPDDPRLDPPKPPFEPWKNKIAFFIPVKFEDQTLAVLATGCPPDQKDIILNRIRLLEPFLNHVAIALKHAQLHQESKEHALIQEINLKIRNTVQEMKQESDLHHVMHTCLIEIQKWKPDLCTLAIHRMVDQTQGIIESFRVDQNGPIKQSPTKNTRPSQMQEWFPEKNELTNQLQTLNTVLINDLDKENPTTANAIRLRFNNHPIQSLIDIPFSRGILSIHSVLPKAFSVREETVFQNIIETSTKE
ncbi:MAG: hypothetical protein HOH77_18925 [Candidatus Latescibacteria bacterium]|nr:hypothetical protein [Candidatus Latescibacterota bacterium]